MTTGDTFDDAVFEDVLAAARAGADWAWTRLYTDLAPAVRGYARGRGAKDPDGVTGDVFLQVVRDLHRFRGDAASFRSWVFTITHHRVIDAARKRNRRREDPRPAETLDPDLLPTPDVATEVLTELGEAAAFAVLDTLTEAQRTVLLLRLVADLSVAETAEVMGKRPGAVKALQHRAVRALAARSQAGPHPGDDAGR